MKPNVTRIPWAWIGCWIFSVVAQTGCQIEKPRFSTSNSVSLTATEVSPVDRSSRAVRVQHADLRKSQSDPDRVPVLVRAKSRPLIERVAWERNPESVGRSGDLFDSGPEPWYNKPPRLVAAESQSPLDSDAFVTEEPFVEPVTEPLADPVAIDESAAEFEPRGISLRDDACDLLPMLRDDVCSLFTWKNAIILGAGVGGALAIRESLDGDVRDYTLRHRQLWGEGSQVMRQFGEFSWQVPFIAGVYGWGLWTQDEWTHEFSKTLISAYAITSIATVSIKGVTNTNRPTTQFQNGEYGFPSFHTASTFSMAAVIDEYYGWPAGVPAYVLAGLVGWSRIDQREHDLSDVLFGSLLGFVIGKSVAWAHLDRYGNHEIVPYYDPASSTVGALFRWRF
jgi:membrane-associated phospholipid phosphatase